MKFSREILLRGVLGLLQPIAALCVRHSIRLGDLSEILKQAFVQEAESALREAGQEPSASKISVVTGVHRKDVSRLSGQDKKDSADKSLVAKVLGAWERRNKTSLNCSGKNSEFARLVRKVSADLNPYTVLFELERIKAVTRDGDFVTLRSKAFLSRGDAREGFRMLARDSRDLIEGVEQNIFENPDIPNLHLTTEYDRIPADNLPQIKAWIIAEGSRFHGKVREFLSKFDCDLNSRKNGSDGEFIRVTLGSFSRSEAIRGDEEKENEN